MHCGIQNVSLPFEEIAGYLRKDGIEGVCLFAPVEDIYNRDDDDFQDTSSWITCRQMDNQYLLDLQQLQQNVFAYYFVWNDFKREELKK